VLLAALIALVLAWQPHGTRVGAAAHPASPESIVFTQINKLTASDGQPDDRFGSAVAVSEDGKTIVIGARTDDLGATPEQGSAYVFEREGTGFVFKQQLFAAGSSINNFGTSVAISGNTIVVGSTGDFSNQGSAYVFVKQGGQTWVQQQWLSLNDGQPDDYFGHSVAISGDTIVVGAFGDDTGATSNHGAAYAFTRSGTTWSLQQKLTASDLTAGDGFGNSVSLSGNTVVVGANSDDINGHQAQGSAYVFTRSGTTWSQQQKLTASDGDANDWFGVAVAVDGDTAVIGASGRSSFLFSAHGSAYIFTRSGSTWTQQDKIGANDPGNNDFFGTSVAVKGDTAVIGAYYKTINSADLTGAAYVFTRTGSNWSQQQRFIPNPTGNALFGFSVGLAGDTLAVGSYFEASKKGAVYVYRPPNHTPTIAPTQAIFSRSAGSGIVNSTIAAVGDDDQLWNTLQVTVNGDSHATINGVTLTNLSVTALGAVKADVMVSCGATDANFTLRVTDDEGSFAQTLIAFDITPNTPPVLNYGVAGHTVGLGGSTTITPASGPSDNGAINFISVQSITPSFSGSLTVFPTGIISIANAAPAGNFNVTIQAVDVCGLTTNTSFTLTVNAGCPAPTVNPPTLPDGMAGTPYNQTLTASGGVMPYTYSVITGSLPNGISLSAAGVFSGAPTAFGTFNFTVRATGANGCQGTRAYTLTISPPCNVTINPSSLTAGTVGAAYNQTLIATGSGPGYTFTISAGALPNGLSLASGGALTGTPTAAGTFNFTAKASDATGCFGTRSYTVTINPVGGGGNAGLQFYPLAHPIRLLDTRPGVSGCDAPGAQIAGGTSRNQTAAGRACDGLLIPANAKALTGNITTVQSGGGYLTLYPSDAAQPLVANSNYAPNEIINNVFTVGLGAGDGAFRIFALNATHVVVDVTGYYAPPAANGLYFHPLPKPIRLLETRVGQTGCYAPGAALPSNADTPQMVQTACGGVTIPATAQALVGNATTVNPTAGGYLTLYPANAPRPLVASANFTAGQIINSPFTVGLSAAGEFMIYTTSNTDLVVDVLGYYSTEANDANGAGLLFNPLPQPVRLLETRAGQTGCYTPNVPLQAGSTRQQQARGACGGQTIAVNALAIVGNATVVNAQPGYLTFWPNGAAQPLTATSNFAVGQILNRHFTVGLGATGMFNIFAFSQTDLVIDVAGFFAP